MPRLGVVKGAKGWVPLEGLFEIDDVLVLHLFQHLDLSESDFLYIFVIEHLLELFDGDF